MTATSQPQTTIANLHQQAETALTQKQFQNTISLCRQILKAEPNFSPAYPTLGKALVAVGDLAAAANTYQQAIKVDPSNAQAYANLGSIYAQYQQWEQALTYYQKASELQPDFAGVYRNIARVWERLNRPERAVKAWERAYSLEPDKVSSQQRLKLGDEFSKLGQIEKAIAFYQCAVESNPNWTDAYQRLGNTLAQAGREEEARETLNKVQELGNHTVSPPTSSTTGSYDQPHASTHQHSNGTSYKYLAQTHAEKQEWQEAIAAAKKALSMGEDAETWHLLAKALHATKQLQQAGHCYRKAIALQPLPGSYSNLGSLYASQQQWQQAIACYQQALQIDSQQAGIWRNLARTLSKAGDTGKAMEAWARAYRLEPNQYSSEQHLQLGDTLAESDKLPEAIACYQNAVQANPNWALAHHRLGETLRKAGRQEEATVSLRRAINCHGESSSQQEATQPSTPQQPTSQQQPDQEETSHQTQFEQQDQESVISQAQSYLEQQQWQQAIATARRALTMAPNATAYRVLGKALEATEQIQPAWQCYRAAIACRPSAPEPRVELGNWYATQQQWKQAIACYDRALWLDPDQAEAYRALAKAYTQIGESSAAAEYHYRALCLEPEQVTGNEHLNLARQLAKQQRWEEAIVHYYQALNADADLNEVRRELATLLAHQGRTEDAIACYRKTLASSEVVTAWQELGGILKEAGQTEQADACYQQVNWLQHQGSLPSLSASSSSSSVGNKAIALSEQAEVAMAHGDWENALEHYRAAFAHLKGNQANSTHNSEASQKRFSMVSNQSNAQMNAMANPNNGNRNDYNGNSEDSVNTLERRANACLEAGDWDRCLVACQELLERAPQYGNGYKLLGQARYGKGEFSQALEAYRQAISLDPQEVEARVWCGQILARQEQWQDAIAYYQQALEQDPQRWQVYHLLGDALQASGDLDRAIAAHEKATELAG